MSEQCEHCGFDGQDLEDAITQLTSDIDGVTRQLEDAQDEAKNYREALDTIRDSAATALQ